MLSLIHISDRASLLCLDLGIGEQHKPVIQQYIKFFASRERTQRFYELELETWSRNTIETALMSVLCKSKTASFEEAVRCILTEDGLEDNKYLAELEKYGLLPAFWRHVEEAFGYSDPKPTLEKLVMACFATYAARSISAELPRAWKPFVTCKMCIRDSYLLQNGLLNGGKLRIMSTQISDKFSAWQAECEARFQQLKANEEELNRIFIGIYGLQDELTPEVADKDVTVHRIFRTKDDVPESMKGSAYVRTLRDEIVSLLSYAVGCMFGRYSLDAEGLAYAGGEWDASRYKTFLPDADNCIPVTDEEYFPDDVVGRLVEFVRVVYGADTLEENLDFIAGALGNKGATSREVIRNYFLNDFIKDHNKTCLLYTSHQSPLRLH